MVFISDGELIRNDFNEKNNQYYALGYDKYTKQFYANKDFFLNTLSYLLDDSGLILSKNKSFKIRLLNSQFIAKNRLSIQLINTIIPVVFIILIGLIIHFIRKRKYT